MRAIEDCVTTVDWLRAYAADNGFSHGDYADTMRTAADTIERLTAELADYRKALEVRNKQLGVACMKHDLVHSLACGICLTETRDLAEHWAILAEQRRVELGECRKDAERLDWLLCRVSGKEYRRIGIEYSAGCLRADIDKAMEAKP